MARLPLNSSKRIIETTVGFPREKGFQLWSDWLKFQAEKSLKQLLVFSEKNGLQIFSEFLPIQVKKSL